MITPKTQAAITMLYSIYMSKGSDTSGSVRTLSPQVVHELLDRLRTAGLIALKKEETPEEITSYVPTREMGDVSLLDILEATGEHLNCNHPTSEEFYARYGKAAHKLGVVNHMTRLYLKDIKLFDL